MLSLTQCPSTQLEIQFIDLLNLKTIIHYSEVAASRSSLFPSKTLSLPLDTHRLSFIIMGVIREHIFDLSSFGVQPTVDGWVG